MTLRVVDLRAGLFVKEAETAHVLEAGDVPRPFGDTGKLVVGEAARWEHGYAAFVQWQML